MPAAESAPRPPDTPAAGPADRHPRRTWFRRHPRLAGAAVLIAGTVLLDVATANILRACGVRWGEAPDAQYRVEHPVYHHGLRPNVTVERARWGAHHYSVFTNSLGFRDREVRQVALRTDSDRVLLIGDSFTEGIGLDYDVTFAGLLQERLRPRGIDVLNAAAVSYAPVIYERKVRHLLDTQDLQVSDVVVCLDISDIQDEAEYYREATDGTLVTDKHNPISEAYKRFIANHTIALKTIAAWVRALRQRNDEAMGVTAATGVWRAQWTFDDRAFEQYGRRGLELATAHMDALAALLEARGIRLMVAVYPWPDQLIADTADSRQVRHWRDWCAQHGATFVDCFAPFFLADPDAEAVIERHFIPGDTHWNVHGHALVAKEIGTALARVLGGH